MHRDIKPGNLILDTQGSLWITDFGLAHFNSETGHSLTMTGDLVGALRYMSPEQALAKRVIVDHRTDIYSAMGPAVRRGHESLRRLACEGGPVSPVGFGALH